MMKSVPVFALIALISTPATAGTVPSYVTAALADPARPADQAARDALRKPGDVIAFAGMHPGDTVADFMPGSGYFTRIFSRVVGAKGHVYAFTPVDELRNCSAQETAGSRMLAGDPRYANVTLESGPAETFSTPVTLDFVWTAENYHDLYDKFMGPTNVEVFDQQVFNALKPGGVFIVIDHVAQNGSNTRDTETLHRIDPDRIKRDLVAVGFVYEGESNALRNPADDHGRPVFDPAIRGRTDKVILKFRKPRG